MLETTTKQIIIADLTFNGAVCQRCGCAIWPTELLGGHMERHEMRDIAMDGSSDLPGWKARRKGKAVKKVKASRWDLPHHRAGQ